MSIVDHGDDPADACCWDLEVGRRQWKVKNKPPLGTF
jgi:hypothetical protein